MTSTWALNAFVAVILAAPGSRAMDPTAAACVTASESGQAVRDEGKYRKAEELFRVCAEARCPAVVRSDCTRWLDELHRSQPTIVVVARDTNGNDLRDVRVVADGEVKGERLDSKPIALDPGEHLLQFERGKVKQERRILVAPGERNRVIETRWQAPAPPPPTSTTAPPTTTSPPEEVKPDSPPPSRSLVAPITFTAIGVAGVGAFAILALTARADLDTLESDPCAKTKTCSPSGGSSIKPRLFVGDIAGAVGIVSLGIATWLWIRPLPSTAPATTGISVSARKDGASLVLRGLF